MEDEQIEEWSPQLHEPCEGYIYAETAQQGRPANKWVKGVYEGEAMSPNGGIGFLFTDSTTGRLHYLCASGHLRDQED